MAQNFQRSSKSSSRWNIKEITARHNVIELFKSSVNGLKILNQSEKKKKKHYVHKTKLRMTAGSEIMQTNSSVATSLIWKGKTTNIKCYTQQNYLLKNDSKIKAMWNGPSSYLLRNITR